MVHTWSWKGQGLWPGLCLPEGRKLRDANKRESRWNRESPPKRDGIGQIPEFPSGIEEVPTIELAATNEESAR